MPPRSLSPSELAELRAASRGSLTAQREAARAFDPELFKAWQGWVWGRRKFDLKFGTPDEAPRSVRRFSSLWAIEYRAAKGKGSRPCTYRHEHHCGRCDREARSCTCEAGPAVATVTTTAEGCPSGVAVSSRGAPRRAGPSLFVLGALVALEGEDEEGSIVRWDAPGEGWILAGCPSTHDMHVVRTAGALRHPPIWILRGRSPYRLTDRGIER